MKTGYYNYTTHEDGLCEFDTAVAVMTHARSASQRSGERVTIYNPQGEEHFTVRPELPSHAERCLSPEMYGFED